jgi:hypothetical protein
VWFNAPGDGNYDSIADQQMNQKSHFQETTSNIIALCFALIADEQSTPPSPDQLIVIEANCFKRIRQVHNISRSVGDAFRRWSAFTLDAMPPSPGPSRPA